MEFEVLIQSMQREYLNGFKDGLMCAFHNLQKNAWEIDDLRAAADGASFLMSEVCINWDLREQIESWVEWQKKKQHRNGTDQPRQ